MATSSNLATEELYHFYEASDDELFEFYENYLKKTDRKAWKMTDIVRGLLTKYTVDGYEKKIVDRISQTFLCYCDTYQGSDTQKMAVEDLRKKCSVVMETIFVQSVIEEKANKNKENAYKKKLRGDVIEELLEDSNSITRKRPNTEHDEESSRAKNPKRLEAKDLKPLSWKEKVRTLCEAFNKGKKAGNRLDITSEGIFPERLSRVHKKLKKHYFTPVELVLKWDERRILLQLARASSLNEVEELIKSIPLTSGSMVEKFIFLALTKLAIMWQSGRLQESSNNEGWYQTHVYGDVLDSIFLVDQGYRTKRTECHAAAIKFLKKAKKLPNDTRDVKVDMLVYNKEYGDVFACEDKPENAPESEVKADTNKNKQLAESRLAQIQLILPYPAMIKYVEVISAQFHGLILTIYGTKMTEAGDFIHYQKSQVTIPNSPNGHYSQAALFLATVISLQRNLILNLTKLQTLCELAREDTIQFLEAVDRSCNSPNFFREDTPDSGTHSHSESSDDSSDDDGQLAAQVREYRIMVAAEKAMKATTYPADLLTLDNWEDIVLMDSLDGEA